MITFQGAQVGYQSVLIDINELTLKPGRIYALVGRNGAGKTTLLQSLIGQLPLISGDIFLNGHSIAVLQTNSELRSRLIAYVASMFLGVEALSLRAYVSLGRMPHLGALGRLQQTDLQMVQSVLETLNLVHLAAQNTLKLSDGERQLASLARAVVQQTPFMILDEPTSFLDYFNREVLVNQLQNWVQTNPERTAIFSSHDIDLCLQKKIDMLILSKGKLVLLEKPTKPLVLSLLEK